MSEGGFSEGIPSPIEVIKESLNKGDPEFFKSVADSDKEEGTFDGEEMDIGKIPGLLGEPIVIESSNKTKNVEPSQKDPESLSAGYIRLLGSEKGAEEKILSEDYLKSMFEKILSYGEPVEPSEEVRVARKKKAEIFFQENLTGSIINMNNPNKIENVKPGQKLPEINK